MIEQTFYWDPKKYTLAKASLHAWTGGTCSRMTPKTLACVVEHLLVQSWQIRKDEARRQALQSAGKPWTPEAYDSPQETFEKNTPQIVDIALADTNWPSNAATVALAGQHLAFLLSSKKTIVTEGKPESSCTLPRIERINDVAAFALAPALVRIVAVGVIGFFVDSVAENVVEGVVEIQRFDTAAAADNEKWIAWAQMQQKTTGIIPEPPSSIKELAQIEKARIAAGAKNQPLAEVSSIVKWAVVGLGLWGAYKVFAPKTRSNPSRYRRRLSPPRKKTAAKKKAATKRNPRKTTAGKKKTATRRTQRKKNPSALREGNVSRELDKMGYRLLGRDPYNDNRWHVARWLGKPRSGSGSVTVGHAPTLAGAIELAKTHELEQTLEVFENPTRKKTAAKKKAATKRNRRKTVAKKKAATKRNPRKKTAAKRKTAAKKKAATKRNPRKASVKKKRAA